MVGRHGLTPTWRPSNMFWSNHARNIMEYLPTTGIRKFMESFFISMEVKLLPGTELRTHVPASSLLVRSYR